MDFFKSVFSDDPEASSLSPRHPQRQQQEQEEEHQAPDDDDESKSSLGGGGASGVWSFGGLMKTLASRSETVIQTYRRDLEEFGSGLRKETEAIREAAARAVRDLPGSLETGASVAQESLESVGQAIDDIGGSVWRGTAEIISHGRDAILTVDPDSNSSDQYSDSNSQSIAASSRRYSRFEAQLRAIQADPATFAEAPEDAEEFGKWRSGFDPAEKEEEIENLVYENGALEGLLEKMVPTIVDYETFWSRYYYRVYKLKQAEDARANLVKRVISREEEEDLSWEVDDDEEGEEQQREAKAEISKEEQRKQKVLEPKEEEKEKEEEVKEKEMVGTSEIVEEKKPVETLPVEKLEDPVAKPIAMPEMEEKQEMVENVGSKGDESTTKMDEHVPPEAKVEPVESCKDSDVSVVSSQPSLPEEDDLGWDEIEDLGEHDDKKVAGTTVSPNRADLRKRLSTAEEDEDLSWDIEDDDEPAKP